MVRGTMWAAVLHGRGDVRVEARPVPRPVGREVLVEVSHCGICGTDLHMVVDGWGRPGSVGGHEWSGRVCALGPDARRFAPGDPVVGGPAPGCGRCPPCEDDRPALCEARDAPSSAGGDGAFAELVCADERALVPVPDGLDLRTAALAEPLAVALHAVTRAAPVPGRRALVSGAGPIGVLAVLALRARGVAGDRVKVSEPNPARRRLAAALGVGEVVAPDRLDVPGIAEPRRLVADRVDVAIECSGRAPAVEAACAQLGPGGRLVLVGSGIEPPRLDPNRILLNELVVTGAFEYDPGGVGEALGLLASGAVDPGPVVEPGDVSLDGLPGALAALAAGEVAGKVLVAPGTGTREGP